MHNFYPIVNFQTGEAKLNLLEITQFYYKMIGVLGDHRSDQLDTVEFSFNTAYFWENLFDIKTRLWEEDLDFAIGSLISIDQLQELKNNDYMFDDLVELFSPAFDPQIWDYIKSDPWTYQTFDYIPGVYSEKDFDELIENMPELLDIKIFPAQIKTAKGLLKALQGPYPELNLLNIRSRILVPGDDLAKEYQIYDNYQANDSIKLVTSPSDYQKIRKEFMIDRTKKILLKPEPRDLNELIEKINSKLEGADIFLTGFNEAEIDDYVDNVDIVATRVFKDIFIDYANGLIDIEKAEERMRADLEENLTAHE